MLISMFKILFTGLLLAWFQGVAAHGSKHAPSDEAPVRMEQKAWGIAAVPAKAQRIVHVTMLDNMTFNPQLIKVKQGQSIRFMIHNKGLVLHEFVMGTSDELAAHAELMKRFPDMEHDEPYMAHVQPGQTVQLLWHFNRAGEFEFACLMPGHFEAGMVGRILVSSQKEYSK